jgi:hypothetical protein
MGADVGQTRFGFRPRDKAITHCALSQLESIVCSYWCNINASREVLCFPQAVSTAALRPAAVPATRTGHGGCRAWRRGRVAVRVRGEARGTRSAVRPRALMAGLRAVLRGAVGTDGHIAPRRSA